MASSNIDQYARSVAKEWERIVLGLMLIVLVIGGSLLAKAFMDSLKPESRPNPGNRSVQPVFGDAAYAYLGEQPGVNLPGRHAFSLPNGSIPQPPKPPKPVEIKPERNNPPPTQPVKPVKPEKTETVTIERTAPPPVKPTPPTIRHYVTYKGYMIMPKTGDVKVLVRYERQRGSDSRGGDEMKDVGSSLPRGLEIESYDDDQIVLKPRNGDPIVVRKGERLEINP